MMIPDCHRRLAMAHADLQQLLVSTIKLIFLFADQIRHLYKFFKSDRIVFVKQMFMFNMLNFQHLTCFSVFLDFLIINYACSIYENTSVVGNIWNSPIQYTTVLQCPIETYIFSNQPNGMCKMKIVFFCLTQWVILVILQLYSQ